MDSLNYLYGVLEEIGAYRGFKVHMKTRIIGNRFSYSLKIGKNEISSESVDKYRARNELVRMFFEESLKGLLQPEGNQLSFEELEELHGKT